MRQQRARPGVRRIRNLRTFRCGLGVTGPRPAVYVGEGWGDPPRGRHWAGGPLLPPALCQAPQRWAAAETDRRRSLVIQRSRDGGAAAARTGVQEQVVQPRPNRPGSLRSVSWFLHVNADERADQLPRLLRGHRRDLARRRGACCSSSPSSSSPSASSSSSSSSASRRRSSSASRRPRVGRP